MAFPVMTLAFGIAPPVARTFLHDPVRQHDGRGLHDPLDEGAHRWKSIVYVTARHPGNNFRPRVLHPGPALREDV